MLAKWTMNLQGVEFLSSGKFEVIHLSTKFLLLFPLQELLGTFAASLFLKSGTKQRREGNNNLMDFRSSSMELNSYVLFFSYIKSAMWIPASFGVEGLDCF